MATTRVKPWKASWDEVAELGQGGHGTTWRARRKGEAAAGRDFALKVLKSQGDPERRARMYREVAALRTLTHPGIPTVIETNADDYLDQSQALYLVTDLVPGPTLEVAICTASLDLTAAAKLIVKLIDTVRYCHSAGVVHRDIKPDNVILRGGAGEDPVLLDFGQSYNRNAADDAVTESGQHMGNRFLALPELQNKSANKRDPRSDLTHLCGLFFYVLTGERPTTLLDEQGRLPHRRPIAARLETAVPDDRRAAIDRFFDLGFQYYIDRRFQSAEALHQAVHYMTDPARTGDGRTTEEKLADLLGRLDISLGISEKQRQFGLLQQVDKAVTRACSILQSRLGNQFSTKQSGGINTDAMRYSNRLGFCISADQSQEFWPTFVAVITGSELVVSATDGGSESECFRAPALGVIDWDQLFLAITAYYVDGLTKTFGVAPLRNA